MVAKWEGKHAKVAAHIDQHIEECLTYLAFPATHHVRIRTTNGLERLNQEIKRRSSVIRIFPNQESCLRLVTALVMEQSEDWISGKRYLNMEELSERQEVMREEEQGLAVVK